MRASIVRARKSTVEVRQQIHGRAIVHARSQNTGDFDADIGLGVVADDGRVDEEGEERVLVLGGVVLEEGGRVEIADRGVRGTALSERGAEEGEGCCEGSGCGTHDGQGNRGYHRRCLDSIESKGEDRERVVKRYLDTWMMATLGHRKRRAGW